jgi:hypothetical protein
MVSRAVKWKQLSSWQCACRFQCGQLLCEYNTGSMGTSTERLINMKAR